ncbi:rRNA adenine N-6-methyltransferase [Trichinella spiralis]|uniref:rRNA adenine N-6-methyltransferase n=1 Tax=Trichinella spiralis TaxID=6334 RepID=A0ABR3L0B2_TRISP
MGSELTSMAAFLLIETQLGRMHHATSGFFSPRPKANKNQSETLVLSNQAGRCALASRSAKQFFFQTSLQKHLSPNGQMDRHTLMHWFAGISSFLFFIRQQTFHFK